MTRPRGIPSTREPHPMNADDFDQTLARCYRDAASQLSTRTLAQLQQSLPARVSPRRHARHRGRRAWGLATACALLVVAALGLRWQALRSTAADPREAIVSATPIGSAMPDNGAVLASLDQPPDLYLWLASDDARAMLAE